MKKPKVLFLCTHNSARSHMAEAFLRKYAGDRFEVYSAGMHPTELHPLMKKVMKEMGFDMRGHEVKRLKQYLGTTHFGYIITVCARAESECPVFPGVSIRIYWPFYAPSEFEGTEEEKLAKFRQVRDQIMEKVRSWVKEVTSSDYT